MVLAACAADLVHEKGVPSDRRRRFAGRSARFGHAGVLAGGASYWTRLPKAELLAALTESPSLIDKSQKFREAAMAAHAKLKKDDLVARVDHVFAGPGYLPDLLMTPVPRGVMELIVAAE